MNVLACYGIPLMDAESRTYIMKIYFASLIEKKKSLRDIEFDI